MLIIIALGAFIATFLGGLFALYRSDKLHMILGFSAGAVIAVAFFDLLPEALTLAGKIYQPLTITSVTAVGFVLFMLADRFVAPHTHYDDHCENADHQKNQHKHENLSGKPERRGVLGASSLSLHSFLDGLAIGLAFHVSIAVGTVVAVAVLVHDFSDGINTVSLILKNAGTDAGTDAGTRRSALKWLTVDAMTPVLGVIVGSFIVVPDATLGIILALFSGFFFYIGASDLLPESHHAHPTHWTTLMTVLGFAVLYTAIKLAGL